MLLTLLKFLAITFCITALIPLGLILSDWPKKDFVARGASGLDFADTMSMDITSAPEPDKVTMRDGWEMQVRRYGDRGGAKPLLLLVHGSGWNGLQYNALAQKLAADAQVLVPDLRGHGAAPERRGDVDYIGQMEDDLADLIVAEAAPEQKVIIAGHSSGGGLVVRFAGGAHGDLMDRAVLLAPFLKYNAPTTRANSGGWARTLTRRIVALSMLNSVGITALNHLTMIQFAMPQDVLNSPYGHLATTSYSFRLNTGYAPRMDYLSDVAALPEFTLVAGSDDEAFYADKYEEVMNAVTDKGSYHLVEGVNHLGIVDRPETLALIRETLQ